MKNLKIISFLLILCCSAMTVFSQNTKNYLISNTKSKGAFEPTKSEEVVKTQNVNFRPDLLQKSKEIKAQLFNETITIYLDPKFPSLDTAAIYGKIKGAKGENYILITKSGKTYTCNILKDGQLYQIRWIGNKIYQLRKIDQSKFPQDCKSSVPKDVKQKGLEQDACANTDPADFIDIMVAYTDDARA
ncbi:MAG: hypothetical protein WBO44_14080, partial [Saprospiraceae bacterium]